MNLNNPIITRILILASFLFCFGCSGLNSYSDPAAGHLHDSTILGIWETNNELSKIRFLKAGKFDHKLLAYIDGDDALELRLGTWKTSSNDLILTYEDISGRFIYHIKSIGLREMILERDDTIQIWKRVSDFEIDESLGISNY